MTDDSAWIIERLRQGDRCAGEELERVFGESLRRFCFGYLRDQTAAEDALQDVFAKVFEAEPPQRLKPWLFRIARNHCLNLLRSASRSKDRHPLPPTRQLVDSMTGALTRLIRAERSHDLQAALGLLKDGDRELLRLRYGENLPRAEVAEIVELPESVVKSRLYEAIQLLRRRLHDQD